ncbi:MAG TPA: P-loop NTPase fold protein [Candidatus Limnocylindria bacterium]|jgi:predicted KAP-like P-loop ATPase|nr:P-loop NTPase fold protein [Candidatus Limnocylindria bacterium]
MKGKRSQKPKYWYSADRPIKTKREDVLGRAKFAERLANDLGSWDHSDSLVVALYGPWGSGKTSVKNMLLEVNDRKGTSALRVLDFNPWQLSGTGTISAAFFRDLGIVLGKEGPDRDMKKRSRALEAYSKSLSLLGTATDAVGKALPVMGIPGGSWVEAGGKAVQSMASGMKLGGEALKAQGEAGSRTLHEQKRDLMLLLSKLPRPVLVVVDDIDRLTTEEIREIFQLVKVNADFPRIIYLLLFEREIVTTALDTACGNKGIQFLEKIVQVGYHMPHASRSQIDEVLFAGLDSLIGPPAISKRWDKQRWHQLYSEGLAGYFENLRNVYRFLASFAFHIHHHSTEGSFEVNPVDLLALESLRLFEPGVYEKLPEAKYYLTRYEGPAALREVPQDAVDEAVSRIISRGRSENRARLVVIVTALFPSITKPFGVDFEVSRHQNEWVRELRVCHSGVFDRYFTLTIGDNELSEAEMDTLLKFSGDSRGFVNWMTVLEKRGLRDAAFDRLESYKEEIPLQDMQQLILSLCELRDHFPKRGVGFFRKDLSMTAWRLVYFGLKREPDKKKRLAVLKNALTTAKGLTLPVEIVSLDERINDRVARGTEFLIEEDDLDELKQICLEKIRAASGTRRFSEYPEILAILWRWKDWAGADEVRRWVAQRTTTPKGVLWLLTVFLGTIVTHSARIYERRYIHLPDLEIFADIAKIETQLVGLRTGNLSKLESTAFREFNKAIKRRKNGEPDDDWKGDDSEL